MGCKASKEPELERPPIATKGLTAAAEVEVEVEAEADEGSVPCTPEDVSKFATTQPCMSPIETNEKNNDEADNGESDDCAGSGTYDTESKQAKPLTEYNIGGLSTSGRQSWRGGSSSPRQSPRSARSSRYSARSTDSSPRALDATESPPRAVEASA